MSIVHRLNFPGRSSIHPSNDTVLVGKATEIGNAKCFAGWVSQLRASTSFGGQDVSPKIFFSLALANSLPRSFSWSRLTHTVFDNLEKNMSSAH